ncbi:MAG: TipAS antibiotic-recognition domain-containing protein [Lachnospiraceae bacterium]|nr:TipAS antibiotic-recognition domain-containing protein [Lachnospiraceae bacterium]
MREADEAEQDRFKQLLLEFGQMYANGNAHTEYLNKMGGAGTAEFMFDAIRIYCGK